MKLIRWILAIAILAIWAALIGTSLYVAMYAPPATLPEGEAIVVLAGDDGRSGAMSGQTELRLNTAVQLYNEGVAPQLVLAGGTKSTSTPSVAESMKAAAVALGVPEDAIVVETESLSTLQNAWFLSETEGVNTAAPVVLVSHRYHLPRANATMRWAGFTDVQNYAADPEGGFQITPALLWESLKWPYNVLRAAAVSAAEAGDVPRENYLQYTE